MSHQFGDIYFTLSPITDSELFEGRMSCFGSLDPAVSGTLEELNNSLFNQTSKYGVTLSVTVRKCLLVN